MSNLFRIEPYASCHEAASRDLLDRVYGQDELSQSYYQLAPSRKVIRRDNRMIGLASVWDNANHPKTRRSGVVVHPEHRRQGMGSQLWVALRKGFTEGRPLVTSLWETQLAGYAFAVRRGFREIRRTYCSLLPIQTQDKTVFAAVGEHLWVDGYRLLCYRDADESVRTQMALLLHRIYVATHRVNPVRHFSPVEWYARAFPRDMLAWGSFAVMYGGECAAVALLHVGADSDRVELGLRGVADTHQQRSRDLMVMTTAHQIAVAADRGFSHITVECDSTDPWSQDVLDSFPFGPAPTWITLRRDECDLADGAD